MNPIEIEELIDKQVKQLKEEKKYICKLKRKLNSNKVSEDERDTIKEYLEAITDLQNVNVIYETLLEMATLLFAPFERVPVPLPICTPLVFAVRTLVTAILVAVAAPMFGVVKEGEPS